MAKNIKPMVVENDPWLQPYEAEIVARMERLNVRKAEIVKKYGSLAAFADGYRYLGFVQDAEAGGWWYREWAPQAKALFLIGDFNGWNRSTHPMAKGHDGVWTIFLSDEIYSGTFTHLSRVKVHVVTGQKSMDRLPAYSRYVTQDAETHDFSTRIWHPEREFEWTDAGFVIGEAHDGPLIYECHVGMAQEKEGVGTYREFADRVLPRIADQGYNAIQVMAIQEHPYYGSFGYHVSNLFAPSSRFGTPDDLKYLVDRAHALGIAVIMDLVHSHAVKNEAEGLARFDGSDDQYFHPGGRGYHTGWDSYLFHYGKEDVLRLLLSNVKYWISEFHFDGYRYDGVTSMLYFHHGEHVSFDHYDKYFDQVDWDVLIYFQLANELVHLLKKDALTIAEDMSGMPGLCRSVEEGGIGFDLRLGMGIPDFWIKLLKHRRDEDWNMQELWSTMTNRRHGERTIAYAESHDQALVGDKTIAFWLMDKEMYDHMHVSHSSLVIDRGIALHNMVRLLTLSLGGEGWLNFIGNEFGHPEWVDFPREGNRWSYAYARRQWSLVDNEMLRYRQMYAFGKKMVEFAKAARLLSSMPARPLNLDQDNHALIFERNNYLFAFNFSPNNSIPDYRFQVPVAGRYQIILNSDQREFGGHDRIDDALTYPTVTLFGDHFLSVYLPNRCVIVLKKLP
ncbi:MAG: alpha amylase C-terminal domain-containing protein [Cyclobacteriaceae bacterium]|nr:alpha amylase C-terminal domain-containing protein [Cyclobacteriaceae bacterium]